MRPPILEEELVREAADFERSRRGQELCLPHTPTELAVARRHIKDAKLNKEATQ